MITDYIVSHQAEFWLVFGFTMLVIEVVTGFTQTDLFVSLLFTMMEICILARMMGLCIVLMLRMLS